MTINRGNWTSALFAVFPDIEFDSTKFPVVPSIVVYSFFSFFFFFVCENEGIHFGG